MTITSSAPEKRQFTSHENKPVISQQEKGTFIHCVEREHADYSPSPFASKEAFLVEWPPPIVQPILTAWVQASFGGDC